jgi:hypothetical protein
MKSLTKALLTTLILGGAAMAAASPASAGIGVSIGIGGPAYYRGYHYDRPCAFYRANDLPAPARCYGYYQGVWGSGVYLDGNFVFRNRDHWARWRGRDDYRHWRTHWRR